MFWTSGWQVPLLVMFNLLSRQYNFFVLPEFSERVTKLNTRDWEMVLLVFSEVPWMTREELSDPFHSWKMLEMLVLYFHHSVNLNNWLNWVKNRFMTSVIFWRSVFYSQIHPLHCLGRYWGPWTWRSLWIFGGLLALHKFYTFKTSNSKLWTWGTQVV